MKISQQIIRRHLWMLFTVLIGNYILQAQEIPMAPGMEKGQLKNGITYYIRENHEPQDHAQLLLVEKAGSLQENENQLGLAHFTEHMAFNGTTSFPKNELIDYLEKAGVRFGADLNAYTSFGETVYQLPIPSDQPQLLESGIKILSEWAAGITFEDQQINSERGVILEEERQRGKDVSERMRKKLLPVYLKDSRYLDRIPIGSTEVINNFDPPVLRDFYNKWYRPELQAVVAVGDFDTAKVKAYIKKYFGNLDVRNGEMPTMYKIPDNDQPRAKVATDPEFPYTILSVTVKHPHYAIKKKKDFYNSVIRSAAVSMLSLRISELVRNGSDAILRAGASYGGFQGGLGNLDAFTLQMIPKGPELLEKGTKELMDEIHKATEFGFTEGELERVKSNFMAAVKRSNKEKDKTTSKFFANSAQQNFLMGEAIIGSDYSLAFYKEYLPQITLEQVNTAVRNLFSKNNQIIVLQAPEKQKNILPQEQELIEWVNSQRAVEEYKDIAANMNIVTDSLTPSKIRDSIFFQKIDVHQYRLSNGATLVLKKTNFKNDQVLFRAFSDGGVSLAEKGEILSAKIADNLIGMSGIGKLNTTQLSKVLTGKSLSVAPYIGMYNEGVKGYFAPGDTEEALQVLYQYFSHPRKDTIAFKRLIEELRINAEAKGSNPVAVFQDTINSVLQGQGKWTQSIDTVNIDKVSMPQAMDFYKERFHNAGDFTFLFVGNFEEKKILPLLEKYIGALPGTGEAEEARDVGIHPLEKNTKKVVYRGLEEKAVAVKAFHGKYRYSPENNLKLKLLKSVLEDRLLKRLREKESGVYSPSVGISFSDRPNPYYLVSFNFSCDPNRVEDLMAAATEEISKLKEQGPTEEDISKFIAQELTQFKKHRRENNYWLGYLENFYEGKILDINAINHYPERLEKLREQDLQSSFQYFLSGDYQAEFTLMPEKDLQEQGS